MFFLGEKLLELANTATIGLFKAAIPAHWKSEVNERIGEFGPFRSISTNHDLIRAVRIAWVKAALMVLAGAREASASREFAWDAERVNAFADQAEAQLREIRLRAFRRGEAPGSDPIDAHALNILKGTPEFAHPDGRHGVETEVTSAFDDVLVAITGFALKDVPPLVSRLARDGLREHQDHEPRSFGELVFSEFAELLKNPSRYPEAMPAFQIYIAGATKNLGEVLLAEIRKIPQVDPDIEKRLNELTALTALGAERQQEWLNRFELLADELKRELSDHRGLLMAILDAVRKVPALDEEKLAAYWEVFRLAYSGHCAEAWLEEFPEGALSDYGDGIGEQLRSNALFRLGVPPLIDAQEFRLVIPDAAQRQLHLLQKGSPARDGDGQGGVVEIGFSTIVDGLCGDPVAGARLAPPMQSGAGKHGLRLAVVSSSGLGKTTTLRRLQHDINRRGEGLAILLRFTDFRDASGSTEENLNIILPRFLAGLGIPLAGNDGDEADNPALAILRFGTRREMESGRLVILIDGLDHITATPKAILRLEHAPEWATTHVVVSGRPQSFQDWRQGRAGERQDTADLTRWRVLGPMELTEAQARVYLAGFADAEAPDGREWRFDIVHRSLGNLILVPRVLVHIRGLDRDKLNEARTAADIYYLAVRNLIEQGLPRVPGEVRDAHVDRLMALLAAIAFQSLFLGPSGLRPDSGKAYLFNPGTLATLRARTAPLYVAGEHSGAFLDRDLADLARLSTLVGNGLLESKDDMPDTLRTVVWANRTIQAFLAAFWLSTWAAAAPAQQKGMNDTTWFRSALFYPHGNNSDDTEELNLFLSEMPADKIVPGSWVAAAGAWYDPALVRGEGQPQLWATEMLARSWRQMHAIAHHPVDDWWDISYEVLANTAVAERPKKGLHPAIDVTYDEADAEAAGQWIALFLGDFQSLMKAADRPVLSLLAADGWADIPAGSYHMGSPAYRQGFPEKTLAYWRQQLALAANGMAPDELARKVSPAAWWTGPQGKRQRQGELDWLVNDVFAPYAAALARGENRQAAEDRALKILRGYFRREDETPEEAEQSVVAFSMAVTPITNAAYELFSPGYTRAIAEVVRNNQLDVLKEGIPEIALGWGGGERPAIHITWFDAWAFAQWANWEEGGRHYGCRLPHEAEWEFACKRRRDAVGNSVPSAFEERYWWGDSFYADDNSPVEEHKSVPEAHAVGWPGATRDPGSAMANGFGLKDMIGNVWEWSANVYDQRTETELKRSERIYGYSRFRPRIQAPHVGASRSMRGGIWYYMNHISTAASRFRGEPNDSDYKIGFRLVREER